MAKQAKFYPVLPYAKKSNDSLHGGKRAAKNSASYGQYSYWQVTYANDAIFIPEATTRGTQQTGNDSASYVNNPGWRVAISKGGNVTSPYSRTVWNLGPAKYSVTSYSKAGKPYLSKGSGQTYGGIYPMAAPSGMAARLDSRASASLKHKLQGYVGNAQLAAPIAESKEIHRLVRQINTIGMDTFKALLAIKSTKGRSAFKAFGDAWLGFGFGVNPLLKDIQTAADSILKYTTRQDQRVRVRGAASEDWTSAQSNGLGLVAYGTNMGQHHYSHHTLSIQYVAGIDLTTRSAASYGVTDHLGLKVGALPSTLWELTPFSWAVDYFVTVGPWLEDMFFTLNGTCKYVSKSTKYQCVTTSVPFFTTIGAFSMNCQGSGNPAVSRHVEFARESLSSLPSQQLRVKSLDEVASHGVTKLLNLASVIAGRKSPNLSSPD
jgi:hypothetical protein